MPKHEGQLTGIHRNLVKHIGVIAVECLSFRRHFDWIERAGVSDYRPADGETALLLDD